MPIKKGESRYKFGKQTTAQTFQEIIEQFNKVKIQLSLEDAAFFWLLYWCGVRKSEGYERIIDDIKVTNEFFIIDFHRRKKGSAEVPALKLPLTFPGVDLLLAQYKKASQYHSTMKLIEYRENLERKTKYVRAKWMFPNIHRSWAAHIVKQVLGEKFYPHFLRLNRITEICSDPTANISRIKSYTGLKSLVVIEGYLGASEKEQDAAMDFMKKQISPKNQKKNKNENTRNQSKKRKTI